MSIRFARSAIVLATLSAGFCAALSPAEAQSVRQQCSAKYQAAKAAGTLNGLAWPQFYSQCTAELKGTAAPAAPATAPAPATAVNPLKPATAAPAPAAPAAVPGNAVFPTAISPSHSNEKPGAARQKTCLDQYNANKATNANGGLKWIQKGGGYYSECNKRLKG
ncbi:MAG TPA: hypothetical protein VEQ35_02830 [Beijerinckia sp.]|jgi:hypothetical protein|nr:hypothetical protein [Beijerinckia sp.]